MALTAAGLGAGFEIPFVSTSLAACKLSCQNRRPMVYHVYIMASESGVLYIGVTNDLEVRTIQHKQKLTPGFTSKYNATKLVYFEPFGDIRDAIAREKQLKRWRREKKVALIERMNATWRDLSKDFHK